MGLHIYTEPQLESGDGEMDARRIGTQDFHTLARAPVESDTVPFAQESTGRRVLKVRGKLRKVLSISQKDRKQLRQMQAESDENFDTIDKALGGDGKAQVAIANILMSSYYADFDAATRWLERACAHGVAEAEAILESMRAAAQMKDEADE